MKNHASSEVVPAVYSREEAALRLGIGLTTLYHLTEGGAIRSFVVGRRRLYLREDVDRWLKEQVAS
jgi:excisionase family DNA binding protein